MYSRFARCVACLACAFSVVACGSDSDSATPADTQATEAAVSTAAPTDTSSDEPDAAVDSSLEALLITSLPDGFIQVDDAVADTGPSDLAKAVRDDGGTDAEQVLTDAGFVAGFQRSWETLDQTELIIVFLYEFSDPDGAASYAERAIASFESDPTLEATPFEINSIPGANGRSMTNLLADGGLASSIVFTIDGYLVQVVVIGATDEANQALAQQLATDQYNRL